jgi:lysophospholipase L1-like esterase
VKKLLLLAAAVTVLLLSFTKQDTMNTQRSLSSYDTILCVGDSLTNGYGVPEGESYPDHLKRLTGMHIIKSGINGETSSEGLQRLPNLLQKYRPKLTILCYGGNDILQKHSISQLKQNLKKMISLCRAEGSDVLLISVPDITLFGLEPLSLYEELSEETGTPLLSGTLSAILEDPTLKSDQIHPNAEGYRKIAEDLYEKIKKRYTLP